MKVLKEDCPVAKRIREIEDFLRAEDVQITHRADGLLIIYKDKTFVLRDGESGDLERTFPSEVDGTKIQTIENYLSGE